MGYKMLTELNVEGVPPKSNIYVYSGFIDGLDVRDKTLLYYGPVEDFPIPWDYDMHPDVSIVIRSHVEPYKFR